jgi:hypothetical protein
MRAWVALVLVSLAHQHARCSDEPGFRSGIIMNDTDGAPVRRSAAAAAGLCMASHSSSCTSPHAHRPIAQVHAHGGHIVHLEDLYLWYGSSQKQAVGAAHGNQDLWHSPEVRLYTAHTLAGPWRSRGSVFGAGDVKPPPQEDPDRPESPYR